jgi:hypothetical protein
MSYVLLLVAVGVTIYALVDCWRSSDDEVQGMPRAAWIIVIVLFWLVGGIAYLLFGRARSAVAGRVDRPRMLAPDDDPEFLRQLDQQQRRAAADERRKREQAERRERKERERAERAQRKERKAEPEATTGPETADGDDHSDHPTGPS